MPSAVRQPLPVDLLHHRSRKNFNVSPGYSCHVQEAYASPSQNDACVQKQHQSSGRRQTSSRRHHGPNAGASPKSSSRGQQVRSACMGLSDSESSALSGEDETVELSSSAKSDSYFSYALTSLSDAYALESVVAPHPSEVPLPPLEWLQSTSSNLPTEVSDMRAFIGRQMAA